MKETTKMSRAVGYLEKMFREINTDSFGGALETPIITVQSTPGAYGHVTTRRTWQRKGEAAYELNISADWLTRPIENVVATLIHEMVHIYHLMNDIQDCSRGGSYHNRKFRDEAEKHMLKIDKDERYGWTITSPTDELLEYIMAKDWGDILCGKSPLWGLLGGASGGAKPGKGSGDVSAPDAGSSRKSNSRRYKCPTCGAIVRATRDLQIICGSCMVEFELTN